MSIGLEELLGPPLKYRSDQEGPDLPFKEQELVLAQEAGSLAIWEWYLGRDEVRWLWGAAAVFGRPLEELRTSADVYALVDPEDREGFIEATQRGVNESDGFDAVYRVTWPNGELHWIRSRGRVVHSAEGERLVIGVAQDVTDMKEREQSLAAQARLLDLAHEPILVRDAEDRITFWNKGAERLYGYTSSQAKGQKSHELLKTRFPEPLRNIEARYREMGSWEGELIHVTKNGSLVHVESRWQQFTDGALWTLETNYDLSQQRALLIAKAWEEKAKLIGELSHEINNPLAAATSAAYMLRQGCDSDSQDYLEILEESITRIADFIRRSNELHQSARSDEETIQRTRQVQ